MGLESYIKGKKGEEAARVYLEQQGYKILEQNYHSSQGEVDLIAYQNEFLVFIEVKDYNFSSFGTPLGAITKNKRHSIIHAAKTYLYKNDIKNINCRFDVISICHKGNGKHKIEHVENAFFAN